MSSLQLGSSVCSDSCFCGFRGFSSSFPAFGLFLSMADSASMHKPPTSLEKAGPQRKISTHVLEYTRRGKRPSCTTLIWTLFLSVTGPPAAPPFESNGPRSKEVIVDCPRPLGSTSVTRGRTRLWTQAEQSHAPGGPWDTNRLRQNKKTRRTGRVTGSPKAQERSVFRHWGRTDAPLPPQRPPPGPLRGRQRDPQGNTEYPEGPLALAV